jgi:hypothetical protein
MEEIYRSYLALLGSLREGLARLTELANEKTAVVRQDDLTGLDRVIKQEQAQAMAFRGLENKRLKLHEQLGLAERPLSGLPAAFPASLRLEAKQAVEALQSQYKIYANSAKVARNTLEIHLHEIDKVLSYMGGAPSGGAGYEQRPSEPPSRMKTDFRA